MNIYLLEWRSGSPEAFANVEDARERFLKYAGMSLDSLIADCEETGYEYTLGDGNWFVDDFGSIVEVEVQ